jgi:hypothetical protein
MNWKGWVLNELRLRLQGMQPEKSRLQKGLYRLSCRVNTKTAGKREDARGNKETINPK